MPDKTVKTDKTESTPAVETLQNLLKEKETEISKYQNLMQNPSMKLVLEKLANGEDVVLQDPTQQTEQKSMKQMLSVDNKTEDLDIDALSNKELVGVMSESVEQYVGQVREEVAEGYQKELADMKAELLSTQQHILKMNAHDQIKNASSKYSDFETYRPEMMKVAEQHPSLSIDDLYIQVKGKHLLESPDIRTLETEKPESSSPFPAWAAPQDRTAPKTDDEKSGGPSKTQLRNPVGGRKNFANLVGNAAQRLLKKQNLGG